MKVSCASVGQSGINAIGKVGVAEACGEDIGMWRMSPSGWGRLRAVLEQFQGRPGCEQLWYQSALSVLLAEAPSGSVTVVKATPTGSSEWVEVDDQHDRQAAERLVWRRGKAMDRASGPGAVAARG
jgi:choline kinase